MTQVSAADNHSITTVQGRWRLQYNDRPLAEASGRGLRYSSRFGMTRRLPDNGTLRHDQIKQVVLGWQHTDESWHLGLVLGPDLATKRGSRWCELVHWPDPEISVFQDLAQSSGQRLAQALGIPFYVIPPQPIEKTVTIRDLPNLPLTFGDWQMERVASDKRRFIIKRANSWVVQRLMGIGWYLFWCLVYMGVSLGTLLSDIALPRTGTLIPNPEWLPYLGIVTSIGLLISVLFRIYHTFTSIDRIFIDGVGGEISARRGKRTRWSISRMDLQSVFVSEVVKKRKSPPATEYGELNFHLGGGKFKFALKQDAPEDNDAIPQPDTMPERTKGVHPVSRDTVHTELQAAAMYIAETMGSVPVWNDIRHG
ncbi:MAG: hypothetical protein AAFV98_21180 [Chloroflexota bacterium]